jgi:hypothetical protein
MHPIIPAAQTPIISDERLMETSFRLFLSDLAALYIVSGVGSPEGVVEARAKKLYMDTAGTAGAILYIKRDADIGGDKTQGWILT